MGVCQVGRRIRKGRDLPMEGTGRITGEVEALLLRSRLSDIWIGVLELIGPELTERS